MGISPSSFGDNSISNISKIVKNNAIKDALAGQALNSYLPRGGLGGSLGGLAGIASVAHNPYALLAMPFFSPRLMGGASYYAGRGTTYLKPLSSRLNPAALSSQFYEND